MKLQFLIVSLLFVLNSWAVTDLNESNIDIKKEIDELGELSAKDFAARVERYRNDIEKYIENKKRVCDGEFTTMVLKGDKELNVDSKNKLSGQEKYICFEEVKNLQILYIKKMYQSRKRYLDYLHEDRIKRLAQIKDTMIINVKKSFAPKKKSRRKRRR